MSETYTVIAGDTFAIISRKKYGTADNTEKLKEQNPGVLEPLIPGIEIATPEDKNDPSDLKSTPVAGNPDEVVLSINGVRFRYWTTMALSRSMDSIDQASFTAPIRSEVMAVIKPFSFAPVDIYVGGTLFFTGTIVNATPTIEDKDKTLNVTCYSTPGVLGDCNVPAYALRKTAFYFRTLRDIAFSIVEPFEIDVVFNEDSGGKIRKVSCGSTNKILQFLTGIAKQKNLLINSSVDGKLVFYRSTTGGSPVAILEQGKSPVVDIRPNFKPQQYFSSVTGVRASSFGVTGKPISEQNPHLKSAFRPFNFKVVDIENSDMNDAVKSQAARMFGSAISYNVTVDTWLDPNNKLWEPNTTLMLEAPDAYINSSYEFIVRNVRFIKGVKSKKAILTLTMPGAFNGTIPEELPWD